MKKEVLILAIISILSLIGGALAYKASRGNNIPGYIQAEGRLQCTLLTVLSNRTFAQNGSPIATNFSTASTTKSCPATIVYELQ